jgi:hypothetical protein
MTPLQFWQARFWVLIALLFGIFAAERVYRAFRPRYPVQDNWQNAVIAVVSWAGVLFLNPFVRF